jgi:hypothetical protein
MGDFSFNLVDVEEKPRRRFRKESKYDPIIDEFCEGASGLCRVDVPSRSANYVRLQLSKRIDARDLGMQIKVSTVGDAAYLEKI